MYRLERQAEPNVAVDLDCTLESQSTLEFCLVRENSEYLLGSILLDTVFYCIYCILLDNFLEDFRALYLDIIFSCAEPLFGAHFWPVKGT